jgi:hypothetical protein
MSPVGTYSPAAVHNPGMPVRIRRAVRNPSFPEHFSAVSPQAALSRLPLLIHGFARYSGYSQLYE